MALTDVDICNLSIGKCSADRIDALGEESPLGAFCAENYPNLRETLLGKYRWNFANTVRLLSGQEIGATETAVMAYKFVPPADLIGAVHDWRDHPDPARANRVTVLSVNEAYWADEAAVYAEYTAVKGEAAWPVWFRNLVIVAFAAEVASFCQLRTQARDLRSEAFGTPQENGEGGLYQQARNEDSRMAPQRQLVTGIDPGPLVESRWHGSTAGMIGYMSGRVR